tara:strand:- start:18918 stop:20390 length:1473 start_codon:yes stop_codon:yes gene_type:complete
MKERITPKSKDYNKWYTDIITKAELADYGPVKGTMVIRPYGFEIWDILKSSFDKRFKETGHKNAYFPLFIPKSFLAKEAEHVEGFAKECAVVTHSRLKNNESGDGLIVDPDSKLQEEIIVRPTSETVIWSMYKKWIHSYRDLPILINQWANVVRWEMRTRLFLRTSEFLWQEGHTAHETEQEALKEAKDMLNIYKEVVQNQMAIPVLTGTKSNLEKFAGAEETYCIEAMMGDKKALQAGTSHYLGQNFSKAFDVRFQTKDNKEDFVYATSWGVSTRLIGALIMVHGDDKGLRLPPNIAPIQVVIVPVINKDYNQDTFDSYKRNLISKLESNKIRYYVDDREQYTPGYKFNEWEMKGVPIRIEIGPRDMNNNEVVLVRRDQNKKEILPINNLFDKIELYLNQIQKSLFNQAQEFQENHTFVVSNYEEFKNQIEIGGFIKCGWDGSDLTEKKIKEETKATIRCILSNQTHSENLCIYSNKPAKYEVIFSKSY